MPFDRLPIFVDSPTEHEFRDGLFYSTVRIGAREYITVRRPSDFVQSAYSAMAAVREFQEREAKVLKF